MDVNNTSVVLKLLGSTPVKVWIYARARMYPGMPSGTVNRSCFRGSTHHARSIKKVMKKNAAMLIMQSRKSSNVCTLPPLLALSGLVGPIGCVPQLTRFEVSRIGIAQLQLRNLVLRTGAITATPAYTVF
jgi:hypothetical protein